MERENKCNECKHSKLEFIGMQEDIDGGSYPLGNCIYCRNTLEITSEYKYVSGNLYKIK